jgi:hypothetical protein
VVSYQEHGQTGLSSGDRRHDYQVSHVVAVRKSGMDYSCGMITSLFWHKKRIDSSERVIHFQYL